LTKQGLILYTYLDPPKATQLENFFSTQSKTRVIPPLAENEMTSLMTVVIKGHLPILFWRKSSKGRFAEGH